MFNNCTLLSEMFRAYVFIVTSSGKRRKILKNHRRCPFCIEYSLIYGRECTK